VQILLVDLTEQALDEGPNYQIQRTNKPNLLAVPRSQTVLNTTSHMVSESEVLSSNPVRHDL
jgi:hypothetical protein